MRFAFIHHHREDFELNILCRVMHVSRSGYHAWVNRDAPARVQDDASLTQRIKAIHRDSKDTYGAVRHESQQPSASTALEFPGIVWLD
jgi:predicted protein tyrosine phosphatase